MPPLEILKFKIDHFLLNAAVLGHGVAVIVIGSHKYSSRIFSDTLASKLHLICVDTRGFVPDNLMFTKSDFTIDKIIGDIEVVRSSLGFNKVILIGHSIHAFIALEYGRRFPENVSHLVLIASSPIVGSKLYEEADQYFEESACLERKSKFSTTMKKFTEGGDLSFVRRMLAFGPRLWYDYNFDASELWNGVEVNPIGAEIIWGSMFADYDVAKALKTVNAPVFLALGRYDYFNPPHLWEEYRHSVLDFTIRIFEKSGHTPQFEEPENFDAELMKWIKI